jgi:uncharacterized membrane protein HdeD (DUF308 family)
MGPHIWDMEQKTQRRLSVVVGSFLLVVAVSVGVSLRVAILDTPFLAFQTTAVAIAGVFDTLAGFDTRVTERVEWYRLSGLGNVFLGISLPFGFTNTEQVLPLVLTVLGGLSIAVIGVDMVLYDGRHVYSEPLSKQ